MALTHTVVIAQTGPVQEFVARSASFRAICCTLQAPLETQLPFTVSSWNAAASDAAWLVLWSTSKASAGLVP